MQYLYNANVFNPLEHFLYGLLMRFTHNLLFLLLIPFSGFAQQSKQVVAYYRLVNQAEIAILDGNPELAARNYDSAFRFKFPDDKDLYNAAVLAYFRKDTFAARRYFSKLAYLGLERVDFPDSRIDPKFFHYLLADFDSVRQAGSHSKAAQTGAAMKALRQRDQQIRDSVNRNPSLRKDPLFAERVRATDSGILADLYVLIRKDGFPSFERCGFWDGSGPWNPSAAFWLLYHQRPKTTIADKMYLKAVQDGAFRPDFWATIIAYRDDEAKYNYGMRFWRPAAQIFTDSNACAAARAAINLEPMADYKRKWSAARLRSDAIIGALAFDDPYRMSIRGNIFLLNYFIIPSTEERAMGM